MSRTGPFASARSSVSSLHSFETLSIGQHNGYLTPPLPPSPAGGDPFATLYPPPPHLTPHSSPHLKPTTLPALSKTVPLPHTHLLGRLTIVVVDANGLNVKPGAKPYVLTEYDRTDSVSNPDEGHDCPPLAPAPGHSKLTYQSPTTSTLEEEVEGSAERIEETAREVRARDDKGGAGRLDPSHYRWNHAVTFDVTAVAKTVLVCLYDQAAPPGGDHGFLGAAVFEPTLSTDKGIDGHGAEIWLPLESSLDDRVKGEIRLRLLFEPFHVRKSLTIEDFSVLSQIGEGGFSRVYRVRKKDTKRIYAMKVINKKSIVSSSALAQVLAERAILQRALDSPFLVSLKFSFQSAQDLFFVMDYKSGGELFSHLQAEGGKFDEARVRFYTAEITLGLEALHSANIIYRDLKPENCLLDASGHLVLVDFGLSKLSTTAEMTTHTLCGTADYLSPQVLLGSYDRRSDWWSLGVMMFEMTFGFSPFYNEDRLVIYENILSAPIKIATNRGSPESIDFLSQLLERDPDKRLGHLGSAQVKSHAFFNVINFAQLASRQISPPFKPASAPDSHPSNGYHSSQQDYTSGNQFSAHGGGGGFGGFSEEIWEVPSRRNSLSEECEAGEIERRKEGAFKEFDSFDAVYDQREEEDKVDRERLLASVSRGRRESAEEVP